MFSHLVYLSKQVLCLCISFMIAVQGRDLMMCKKKYKQQHSAKFTDAVKVFVLQSIQYVYQIEQMEVRIVQLWWREERGRRLSSEMVPQLPWVIHRHLNVLY